jgi:hypothetical protein
MDAVVTRRQSGHRHGDGDEAVGALREERGTDLLASDIL